jgi:hypothetical protein
LKAIPVCSPFLVISQFRPPDTNQFAMPDGIDKHLARVSVKVTLDKQCDGCMTWHLHETTGNLAHLLRLPDVRCA